jgi:two-component system, cell cycle sensor histidine kinase and response regulator CckA
VAMSRRKRAFPGKVSEGELFASQERFQKAFTASPDLMTISTWDHGRCLDCNDSFLQATGYQRAEVLGRTGVELRFWPEAKDRSDFLKLLAQSGRIRDLPVNFVTKSGEMRTGLLSAEVIEVTGQKSILTVTKDLTEHRKLEQQLQLSQRMEAVGRLAGGIAHDFNNLLTVIFGSCVQLLGTLQPGDARRSLVEEIQQAGDRAALLTRQLLAFGYRQALAPRLMDLNEVVRDSEKILRRLLGEDIDLVIVPSPEVASVQIDPGQMEQVLLNLAVNARDAMPNGGKLTIETASVDVDESYSSAHPPLPRGSYMVLAVSDTGCGMTAETQVHIFEPFFTTKEVGKGTGLGLAMVYGIVKQSGGFIWLYSEVGHGTTFKIYLPRARQAALAAPVAVPAVQAAVEPASQEEIVLLVEDEAAVRRMMNRVLVAGGYKTLEARDGEEALDICARSPGPVHLLITDLVMPLMAGPELARRLQALYPQLKVLYVSGYTDETVVHHGIERGAAFLQKPFTPDALCRKAREVLETANPNQQKL